MPAHTAPRQTRPATDRQMNFLRSLAADRVTPRDPAGTTVALALAGQTIASRDASAAIEALLASPRRAATPGVARPSTAPGSDRDAVAIMTPKASTRAGRMLLAGGIEATVTLPSGLHVTINVRTRARTGRGWTNAAPQEQGARTTVKVLGQRVGWINVDADGNWTMTVRTRRDDVRQALAALFAYCAGSESGCRVQEASRCGRCMRTLTDPVSIDRGIGPECFGRDTGSQHIAADRPVLASAEREAADIAATIRPLDAAGVAAAQAEAAHDAAFARQERLQEERAYRIEMEQERAEQASADRQLAAERRPLTEIAAVAASPARSGDEQRARDMIAEALDAYYPGADRDFAMRVFDQLAAR